MKVLLWATEGIKRAFSRHSGNARFSWDVSISKALALEDDGTVRVTMKEVYDKTFYDGYIEYDLYEFQDLVAQFEDAKLRFLSRKREAAAKQRPGGSA